MLNIFGDYIEESYIDHELNESIDMTEGLGGLLHPIFVVLIYSGSAFARTAEKIVKDQDYWHASIGFGPALSRLYSFNYGHYEANRFKGGLSFESVKEYKEAHSDGKMEVSCILLSTVKYNKLKAVLDYYMNNKEKTKYSFLNLAYSLFGKHTENGPKFSLVCSTFVDTILKSVNINVSGQQYSNLVKPDDLKASDEKGKYFKVFEGKIKDYDATKVAKIVENMYNDKSLSYFNKKKNPSR